LRASEVAFSNLLEVEPDVKQFRAAKDIKSLTCQVTSDEESSADEEDTRASKKAKTLSFDNE
jgi:hypothetical protein